MFCSSVLKPGVAEKNQENDLLCPYMMHGGIRCPQLYNVATVPVKDLENEGLYYNPTSITA